jgi:DNA/RNA endonuclease YhcR with UshA esterase domain
MTRARARELVMLVLTLAVSVAQAQKTLTAAEAKDHIGEKATVCGNVVSTRYATRSRGNPTFINLDKPYPDQVFTVLIWGSDRPKFGEPEQAYQHKRICVTGKISDYKGVPEIVANEPSQIRVQ